MARIDQLLAYDLAQQKLKAQQELKRKWREDRARDALREMNLDEQHLEELEEAIKKCPDLVGDDFGATMY